jgi:hypothetical protein
MKPSCEKGDVGFFEHGRRGISSGRLCPKSDVSGGAKLRWR